MRLLSLSETSIQPRTIRLKFADTDQPTNPWVMSTALLSRPDIARVIRTLRIRHIVIGTLGFAGGVCDGVGPLI